MAEIIGVTSWTLAAFIWGDWRNFHKYHVTILYFVLGDLLYYYITYTHRLWSLTPTWPLTSELVCIVGEFIVFAGTILIFLGRHPDVPYFSIWWTFVWVSIYTVNEWILLLTGTFTYSNGWTLFHSFLFNIIMFIFLRLHVKRPLLTYALSVPMGIFLIWINDIPVK